MVPDREILQDILERLIRIEEALRPRRCTPADFQILEKLIPAAGGKYGSGEFTVRELLRNPEVAGLNLGNHQVIGNALSRAALDEANIAGLRIQAIGRQHNQTMWMVTAWLPRVVDAANNRGLNSLDKNGKEKKPI